MQGCGQCNCADKEKPRQWRRWLCRRAAPARVLKVSRGLGRKRVAPPTRIGRRHAGALQSAGDELARSADEAVRIVIELGRARRPPVTRTPSCREPRFFAGCKASDPALDGTRERDAGALEVGTIAGFHDQPHLP